MTCQIYSYVINICNHCKLHYDQNKLYILFVAAKLCVSACVCMYVRTCALASKRSNLAYIIIYLFSFKEQLVKNSNIVCSIIIQAFLKNKNVYLTAKYMHSEIPNEMINN